MKSVSRFGRGADVPRIIEDYDTMERNNGSIPGVQLKYCNAQAGTCQTVSIYLFTQSNT